MKQSQDQKVEELCRQFKDLWQRDPSPQIDPFLKEVDDDVRPQLAAQLLRIDIEHRRRIGPAPDLAELTSADPQDRPSGEYQRPSGEYQIVSQITAGKSGLLYRAISHENRSEVDVLVLGNLGEADTHRIKKRISLTSQLAHPAVARIIKTKWDDHEQSYLLEPIADRSLFTAVASDHRSDAKSLLSWGYQVASVVAAGHRLGLSHGDLSPESVRIRPDGNVQLDYVRTLLHDETEHEKRVTKIFRAPEVTDPREADAAADVYSLASLLVWLVSGSSEDSLSSLPVFRERLAEWLSDDPIRSDELDAFCEAVKDALSLDPAERVAAKLLCGQLEGLAAGVGVALLDTSDGLEPITMHAAITNEKERDLELTWDASASPSSHTPVPEKTFLGRFRILEKLGEGGMGEVFKAVDPSDGSFVAIKVLSRSVLSNPAAIRRFHKEARLLGQIKSPYVTNLLEVNEDNGQHFLAMEFVSGSDLRQMIKRAAPFDERVALSIIADAARGLVSAHEQEIIHRDIKPANILMADDRDASAKDGAIKSLSVDSLRQFRVKLSDFGLARQLDQSESMQLTQAGGFLGTPYYMSPEQFSNQDGISPATDVYAMGITLYQMLAGRVPFKSSDLTELINKHCRESPPQLTKLNPSVSEATWEIVQRSLAKDPHERYADAAQFLHDVERLLRGEPSNIDVHPQMPPHNPAEVFEEVFQWQLKGSAADLWPYVSNTERINRAVGVPSVVYDTRRDAQGRLRKYGAFRMAGLQIGWEEHPFEWVEGQRLGILREFNQGPFVWFLSIVELVPQASGGTLLRHTVRILPRGLVGRMVAKLEVTIKGKRNLERVYTRIDQSVTSHALISPTADPFADSETISRTRRRRLEERLDKIAGRGIDPSIIECIGTFLREAPSQELARIRPLALARNFRVDPDRLIAGCLMAAKEGLLDLRWDILCPTCRISSQVADTFKDIENHARCEVCDLDFEVDLANSVEMIFRAHPEIREADLKTYCIGGPEHFPHVVLQVRMAAGQRVALTPVLSESEYVLRSAQLTYNCRLRAMPGRGTTHTEIVLSPDFDPSLILQVRAGRNVLTITNDYDHELVIRLERRIPTKDVVTAAQAASMPAFRELFPDQSPKLGRLLNVATVTLLAIDIWEMDRLFDSLGDSKTFSVVQSFHGLTSELMSKHGGSLIKTSGTDVLFAFDTPHDAVQAVSDLADAQRTRSDADVRFCAALHCGTVLATSIDGQLSYFGGNVHVVKQLLRFACGGELWMTEAVACESRGLLATRHGLQTTEIRDLPTLGKHGIRCQRVSFA